MLGFNKNVRYLLFGRIKLNDISFRRIYIIYLYNLNTIYILLFLMYIIYIPINSNTLFVGVL